MFSLTANAAAKFSALVASAKPAHAVKSKTTAATGYAAGHATYGEWVGAQRFALRALVAAGEFMDKYLAPKGAPIFPKDAPLMQPNCGVVALAMFTRSTYAAAVATFAGRNSAWLGGTYATEFQNNAKKLGFETAMAADGMTLAALADSTKGQPETHFATVQGHAVAVWDGLIFDQNYPAGATGKEHFTGHCAVRFHMVRA